MIDNKIVNKWSSNDLPIDIRHQWIEHTRATFSDAFPRDIGYPASGSNSNDESSFYRYSIGTPKEMVDKVFEEMVHSDVYVNVFSNPWQRDLRYDTCYIDMDADMGIDKDEPEDVKYDKFKSELKEVHWELKKFVWHMEQVYDETPRTYFSGGRGFSIYTDFEQLEGIQYEVVYETILRMMRDADVDMSIVDQSVFENNRVSRLPYTLNWSNMDKRKMDPLFCIPIDPTWSFDETWKEITEPSRFKEVEINRSGSLANHIEQSEIEPETKKKTWDHDSTPDPESSFEKVEFLMGKAGSISDGRHRILHFIMVPALLEAGWSTNEQVHSICSEFIERSGESYYPKYHNYVENSIDRTLEGPAGSDEKWRPWTISTFLENNPDLIGEFVS